MSLTPFARSPLAVIDEAVHRLEHAPVGFTIDPVELGIPTHAGRLSIPQVRDILSHRDTPIEVKNQAWAALITRAQRGEPVWTLAALGIALPRLRRLARDLTNGYRGSAADLDAEIVTGFLTALAHAHRQQRFPALIRAARLAGLAWTRHCRLAPTPTTTATATASIGHPLVASAATTGTPTADNPPAAAATASTANTVNTATAAVVTSTAGHPDLVLADAVAAGVLTAVEAEIIAATRLEHRPLRVVAAAHQVSVNTLWMRRDRAEKRLVAALTRAVAADDADHADDPTHAHLLTTTPLAQRLRQPAPTYPAPSTPSRTRHYPATHPRDDRGHGEQAGLATPSADMASRPISATPGHHAATDTGRGHHTDRFTGHASSAHASSGQPHLGRPSVGHPGGQRPEHPRPSSARPSGHTPTSDRPANNPASRVPSPAGLAPHRTPNARPSAHRAPHTSTPHTTRAHSFPALTTPLTTRLIAPLITIPALLIGSHQLIGSHGLIGGFGVGSADHTPLAPRALKPIPTSATSTTPAVTAITSAAFVSRTTMRTAVAQASVTGTATGRASLSMPHRVPRPAARLSPPRGYGDPGRPGIRHTRIPDAEGRAGNTGNGRPGPARVALAPTQASPDGTAQLTRVLTNIRNWLMGVLITLATLCLTVGGVRYLIAGGDPGEVEAAKRAIKSAAIGYALAALAPALVAVLRNLVGV